MVEGVEWNRELCKWVSFIHYNGKVIFLGSFINKSDAILARIKAESEYYGKVIQKEYLFLLKNPFIHKKSYAQYRLKYDENGHNR